MCLRLFAVQSDHVSGLRSSSGSRCFSCFCNTVPSALSLYAIDSSPRTSSKQQTTTMQVRQHRAQALLLALFLAPSFLASASAQQHMKSSLGRRHLQQFSLGSLRDLFSGQGTKLPSPGQPQESSKLPFVDDSTSSQPTQQERKPWEYFLGRAAGQSLLITQSSLFAKARRSLAWFEKAQACIRRRELGAP